MTPRTATLEGRYYDGQQPIGSLATLIVGATEVALIGSRISGRYRTRELRVSPRTGRAERFIALPNGGQFQCADHRFLDRLPQEIQSEGAVAWLEQRVAVALACVAVTISLLLAGYFYGLPAVAQRVAARVPIETERALGQQVLVWLDENKWFRPTKLDEDTRAVIRKGFNALSNGLPMERYYRLEFRDSPFIGANAFALPGGAIVITDQMVNVAESREEVLAVLAHEIGHVELRHSLRHVLQDSATAVVAATITADAASLSVAVSALPALLAQTKYSREFETEADDFAFRLLKRRGLSPEAFATIMERLAGKREDTERGLAFVSTHPVTAERVRRAREAAAR